MSRQEFDTAVVNVNVCRKQTALQLNIIYFIFKLT